MANRKEHRVRVTCDLEGYEEFWVEYDVTDWGIDIFASVPFRTLAWMVHVFIPEHTTAWYIVSDDGAVVAHPGRGASEATWTTVYKQIGPETGRALWHWLGVSALSAMGQATEISPKSLGAHKSAGGGEGDGGDAD